ncbi:S8 family peptidase [Mesorhizobium sp. CO1-1-8]|uniref:S8 family peptidase n=1 Tax=Mesorhizobium sp. CO1-1-8 TaxID=2876631 RepID=UPI001CD1580F|nr:S8 family peptidase [Mesorhizobium sp. CO1-1-8]MBZ9776941.1 S8 family peptidase [Mesorhizobium sp. CO1-1-8]
MPTRFTLPHIDISALHISSEYTGSSTGGSSNPRIRAEHAAKLINELNAAFVAMEESRGHDERLETPAGGFVEVELKRGTNPTVLERKTEGIKPGAVKDTDNSRTVALFVPDHAREALTQILQDYRDGPLTEIAQKPPNASRVEPIEAFRRAHLGTFWTDDPDALPIDAQHEMWWAIWTHLDKEAGVEDVCRRLDVRAASRDRRMYFPEAVVIPVFARRAAIELMTFTAGVVDELRRATDNPAFFIDDVREEQHEWNDDLAGRIVWPGNEVPAVCLLDTGVNRAHALLEPALAANDQHAVNAAWGVSDHDGFGHGTAMAGLALHGDLTAQLADTSGRVLAHRLETVKLIPPHGADPNDPNSYGIITQAAISLPEIAQPERSRVFCMAVTNDRVSGATPSTWSAAIDQASAGTMIGDDEDSPKRLFVISAGNVPPVIDYGQMQPQDIYPAEDPCQAWNALTVGACTDLADIHDSGYEDWTVLAKVGALSPHSRTSVTWSQGRAPIKPEIVLEGGNRALSPSVREVLTLDSLCLLSTGKDTDARPLVSFHATSAATAQAARMATQLSAAHPEYWPETIRALMVHSAEWTTPMLAEFAACPGRREKYEVVRRFGYGVADLDRATASAQDHLALVAQAEIQPFRLQGQRKFNECHYYDLPLPAAVLEQLNNETVQLKVTLSYFIDPNPGFSANVDPQRYQSYGLRFDLRRRGETLERFRQRVNAAEREDGRAPPAHPDDDRWMLGPNSVSAGSLHCDVWTGPAIDLLGRDKLCIKPVMGWWRSRAARDIVNRRTRYSLVVTLKASDVEVDLYTPVRTIVDLSTVSVETQI